MIWFAVAGWWLALGHRVAALLLAITLFGISFAWKHLKLARLTLTPVNTAVVPAP